MSKHLSSAAQVAETLQKGLAHHRAGRLSEASACYSCILEIQPAHADALHLSGVISRQQGDMVASERLIAEAIQIRPSVAVFHHNLGHTYELLGKQSEAIQSYRRALSLDPRNLDTLQRLTNAMAEQADLAEVIALYEALLSHTADSAAAHNELGRLRQRRGELQKAVDCYRRAIALQPDRFEFHFNLAAALFEAGEFGGAAASYRQATLLQPEDAEAHYSLGVVLQEMGDNISASKAYVKALQTRPELPNALCNLGSICMEMGDLSAAEDLLRRSIAVEVGNVNAHCGLANVLAKQGNAAAAIESFRTALTLDSRHAATLCNLGALLDKLGNAAGAAQCFQLALDAHPDSKLARFYLSTHHLAAGDFIAGWSEYEARWATREFRVDNARPALGQPQWRGEDIRGSRILIYAEQGLGDTLQFVRYVSMVAALGATVVLRVQPPLVRLLSKFDEAITVVSTQSNEGADFEWQCPLMSLPLAFRTDLETIPSDVPYLRADPIATKEWLDRLPVRGLRIGLVWAGNPKHSRDRQRSISLQRFGKLTRLHGVSLYLLQKGQAAQEFASTSDGLRSDEPQIVDLSGYLEDFTDTAAIIANLDLVISVDTSVAHLAGAMGKPVWVLVPRVSDWRWLRDRTDSPWYPTMRLFRQATVGEWREVVEEIERELKTMLDMQHPFPASAPETNAVALQA